MKLSPCLLGFGLLGASFLATVSKENPLHFLAFEASLDDKQKALYHIIKRERLQLYLTGLTLGTLIALANLYYFNDSQNSFLATICLFVTISWGFTLFYYMLMPKSTYMVQHLTSQNQIDKWVDVYRDMQWRYIIGFLLGIIAYSLLCYGVIKC